MIPRAAARSTPVRVMVADDDATMRHALCELISADDGLDVVGMANDAQTALEQCAQTRPNVVLLDVGMPGGGVHAARTIRQQHPHVVILALTARDDDHTRRAMLEAGAVDVLIKGLRRGQLLDAIRAVASST